MSYVFDQCRADDGEVSHSVSLMQKYAARYNGQILTNFDGQLPHLKDAPLSYQRLLAKTYDRVALATVTNNWNVKPVIENIKVQLCIGRLV